MRVLQKKYGSESRLQSTQDRARTIMVTPAVILGLLIIPFVMLTLLERLTGRRPLDASTAGCVEVTFVFFFTSLGHFLQTEPMAEMLPPWVPGRIPLVYLTGLIEFAAAIAILVPQIRRIIGWALIVMLLLFLPINIYAAAQRVGMGGHQWGPIYLLIRVPLQMIIIAWIWWFAVRSRNPGI